jgi:hypothetical protein
MQCLAGAHTIYLACKATEATNNLVCRVSYAFNTMSDAAIWLADHPLIAIGTIVVVGVVIYVVSTGGVGGLVLVPAIL